MSDQITRLCPGCGTPNDLHLEVCQQCGASLRADRALVPVEKPLLPALAEAALPLAVTVGLWLARTGLKLLIERAVAQPVPLKLKPRSVRTRQRGQRIGTVVEHTLWMEGV